jgi:Rrf2 family cysteine metabolism transcriptional repressor
MLHISTRGEYGVRVMIDLGNHYGRGVRSLTEIAQAEGLPMQYLEQLIKRLRDADLVVSARGAHGGYQLSRAPDAIKMSDVIRSLESLAPFRCLADDSAKDACDWDRLDHCSTRVLWARLRDAIVQTLDSITLADLLDESPPLGMPIVPTVAGIAKAP